MDAVIGLGGNLGERRAALGSAVIACGTLGELIAVSALYETEPIGPPQPRYLNAALRLSTPLSADVLLAALLEIERRAGRVRAERWAARVLDLDVLWIGGVAIRSDGLVVPHPELAARAFALLPLLDVAPDATDPVTGIQYARIAAEHDASGVTRIDGPEWWRAAKIQQSFPY